MSDWTLVQYDDGLASDGLTIEVSGAEPVDARLCPTNVQVTRGLLWAKVRITTPSGGECVLDALPNRRAATLSAEVGAAAARRGLLCACDRAFESAIRWYDQLRSATVTQLRSRGWLTSHFVGTHERSKPVELDKLLKEPLARAYLACQDDRVRRAVDACQRPVKPLADSINQKYLARERVASRAFFDTVEKSPLTTEQVDAVICFDNRVLLVAAAGSGKTATMIAKAGYALHKGYFGDGRVLLLAFNTGAARELQERLESRLAPLGLDVGRVSAKTFHAFGLEVIGQATGKRPSVAPWVESGKELEVLLELVDELKDSDRTFRTDWDLYRLVLHPNLPKFGEEEKSPSWWDPETRRRGFLTLNREVVKSRAEQVLADWFFYNGVKYQYEQPYKFDTADAHHQQYRPDFYLPEIDAYLELWALDANGQPPPGFRGYAEGIAWKRNLHSTRGTVLLEVTIAELYSGEAFRRLEQELPARGIRLAPNPDRPAPGRKVIDNPRLLQVFRTFLTHFKTNRVTVAELHERAAQGSGGAFRYRQEVFLRLFEPLYAAWERRLQVGGYVDFDDMLNRAADCIEQGRWASPYDLVMVDEFQDVSQARARIIRGLGSGPDRAVFAVGDDWQGINRFAGADISVMTEFEQQFGKAVQLKLQTTFRCPQALCDVSGHFIQKNPKQLRKTVMSAADDVLEPVRVISVESENEIREVVRLRLEEIRKEAVETGGRPTTVYLMGRYRDDRQYVGGLEGALGPVTAQFTTVHSSKGLEADYVILLRVTADVMGFPSKVEDDPVLQLVLPNGESYPYAEERRLFYVALTRARRSVTVMTVGGKGSPFIAELVGDHKVPVFNAKGEVQELEVCPGCGEGFMVRRSGATGPFWSCSRFPSCEYKRNPSPRSYYPRAGSPKRGNSPLRVRTCPR